MNAGLIGEPGRGWNVSTFFNYTGPQIWALGFDKLVFPHQIERGRASWEWQVSKRLGLWELRLAIWDVINTPYRRVQVVQNRFPYEPDRDALAWWVQESWRVYFTIRYHLPSGG